MLAKLEEVTRLMGKLSADLQHINLLPHRTHIPNAEGSCEQYNNTYEERDALLEQVKVYGRDPTNAEPIFTKEASRTCSPPSLQKLTCT